jgi:hypothetical protein
MKTPIIGLEYDMLMSQFVKKDLNLPERFAFNGVTQEFMWCCIRAKTISELKNLYANGACTCKKR